MPGRAPFGDDRNDPRKRLLSYLSEQVGQARRDELRSAKITSDKGDNDDASLLKELSKTRAVALIVKTRCTMIGSSCLAVLVVSLQPGLVANALTCYECRSGSISSTDAGGCVSAVVASQRECDKMYCTIYRREYIDPPGKLEHFYRSCESNPAYLNDLVETRNHRTYYSACDRSLCNVGDGLVPFATTLDIQNKSDARVYVVPGVGSSADRLLAIVVVVVAAVAAAFVNDALR